MGEEVSISFSAFEGRLSPVAFACFKVLIGYAREEMEQDGTRKIYEMPLDRFIQASGSGDIETAAQSVRDIIQCRVEMKKGDHLYFFPFLSSISFEEGMVRYSLLPELESALPSVAIP